MNPYPSFVESCVQYTRYMVLYIAVAIIYMNDLISIPQTGGALFSGYGAFTLMVAYWSLYRPTLFPNGLLIAGGILADIYSGMPLGITPLVWLMAKYYMIYQRQFLLAQSFSAIWSVVSVLIIMYHLIYFAMICILRWHLFGMAGMAQSILIDVLLFPVLYMVCHVIRIILPLSSLSKNTGFV